MNGILIKSIQNISHHRHLLFFNFLSIDIIVVVVFRLAMNCSQNDVIREKETCVVAIKVIERISLKLTNVNLLLIRALTVKIERNYQMAFLTPCGARALVKDVS